MKRLFAILMALVLMLGLCACGNKKSELEIAREEAERSKKAAQDAWNDYNDLVQSKNEYDFWQSILGD